MRGTEIETELRNIRVRAIALVKRGAIDAPLSIIKSEDGTPDKTIADPVASLDDLRALLKEVVGPMIANNNPFPQNATDPRRDEMLKSLKDLAVNSTEMLKEQREKLAVVCKYHGVEGPEITDEEDPQVTPAMQSMMSKMDGIITAMNGVVTAIQASNKPAPVAKEEEAREVVDPVAIEKAVAEHKALKLQVDLLNWKITKAQGKDPGPKPE